MSRGKKFGMILMTAAALCMSACGAAFPDMTEEQSKQIVEYASGLLLRHDKNYQSKLVKIEEQTVAEETVAQEEPKQPEPEPQPQQAPQQETQVANNAQAAGLPEYSSVEEFYGIEGVAITYTGHEVKDMYPETDTEDIFFAMKASTGNKLLVLNFDVANTGGSDLNLDMISQGAKFKISIDGRTPQYALTTMLTNDLASYMGTIPVGSSQNLVLVTEVPEEEAGSLQSFSLVVKKGSEDAVIALN